MKQKVLISLVGLLLFFSNTLQAQAPILPEGVLFPDNVVEACSVLPPASEWSIKLAQNLGAVSTYMPAIVGDLDGDGLPEIVIGTDMNNPAALPNSHTGKKVKVFKGGDLTNPIVFSTQNYYCPIMPGVLAIARVPISGVYKGLIVVAESDLYLHAYDMNGVHLWKSSAPWITSSTSNISGTSVGFADFNNDGKVEVYAGSRIYDAATGTLLCAGTSNEGRRYHWSAAADMPLVSTCAADVYGDKRLELIAGNEVYEVAQDLTSMTVVKRVTPPASIEYPALTVEGDGTSIPIDVNGDGKPEILTLTRSQGVNYVHMYIWDVENEVVLAQKTVGSRFNNDGDGSPEILMITSVPEYIYAFKYVAGNNILSTFWTLTHSDTSGMTGLVLFDFNQNNTSEIVYRDETTLRIINGSVAAPYNLAEFTSYSGTGYEYPVVVDYDGDGAAEILIAGGTAGSVNGTLGIYKSDGSAWAPARPVWNQYMYNPVYVNKDLTIPKSPMNPATIFPGTSGILGGTTDIQPFNNFLQQQTTLSHYGTPLWLAPNGQIVGTPTFSYNDATDGMTITLDITNAGDMDFQSPFYVTVYKDNISSSMMKFTHTHSEVIEIGETVSITFTIPNFLINGWVTYNFLVLKINDKGDGLNDQDVCDDSKGQYRYYGILPTEQESCKDNIKEMVCSFTLSDNDTYQWQYSINDITWTDISGATGKTYKPSYQKPGMGYYRVIVTDKDYTETIASASVNVLSRRCVMPVNPNTHLLK